MFYLINIRLRNDTTVFVFDELDILMFLSHFHTYMYTFFRTDGYCSKPYPLRLG